jgi:hypothetical protein
MLPICVELDVPATSTFAGSSSLGGSYLPIHQRKRPKGRLSCQMLSFHWKLDLRLDFLLEFS